MISVVQSAATARADERGPNMLRLDLGAAYSLRAGDERDSFGFGGAFEYERRFHRYIGIGVRVAGLLLPYNENVYDGPGWATYAGVGPNLRLHLTPGMRRGDFWIAGGAQLVVTGSFVRPGLDAGLGFDIGVGSRGLAIGPFARYLHVIQPNGAQRGGNDGRMLFFGLSLSYGRVDGVAEPEVADRDADGVEDADDACPDEPANTPDGCPVRDGDGDGVADAEDECPEVPGVAPSGCPRTSPPPPDLGDTTSGDTTTGDAPVADRDGDGVPDGRDRCPDVAAATADGCPAAPSGEVAPLAVRIYFSTDSVALSDESVRQLLVVRDRLRDEPGIARVLFVGHADRLGEQDHNDDLAERRARAALEFLLRRGVSRSRLESRGVGTSQPVVDGNTPDELAPNRRVEIYIVDPPVDSVP